MMPYIEEQISKVRNHEGMSLLSEQALSEFKKELCEIAETVSGSTVKKLITDEVMPENPFAALNFDFITIQQKENAEKAICEKLKNNQLSMPEPLMKILHLRFENVTNAFLEMLERILEHYEEICSTLLDGKTFTRIEEMELSAGDTHNHGRAVVIFRTDAGKLVYKPHDMRGDVFIYNMVNKYFSDFVKIPKCIAFGDKFGVCEFVEKQHPEGEESARIFYHHLGGTAAFMKMLGSTDMHVENVTCSREMPCILDLETIVSPEIENLDYQKLHPELWEMKSRSPYLSCLLPSSPKGTEYSILMNTTKDGCSPVVNGKFVSVMKYFPQFQAGYHEVYQRIMFSREELSKLIKEFSSQIPVRLLIRNTQYYFDTMIKLYHHNALSSDEKCQKTKETLSKILHHNIRTEFQQAVESEINQLERGDIPYVYTYADCPHLYSDGEIIAENIFQKTAEEHILNTLSKMDEKDEAFDLALFERSIMQYPVKLNEADRDKIIVLKKTDSVLSKEQALQEARKLFDMVHKLRIPSPDGKLFWGYINEPDFAFRFCEFGLTNGLIGIAVFTAGYAMLSDDEQAKIFSEKVVNEAVTELERMYGYLEEKGFTAEHAPYLGESDGIGGVLKGLALLKRYTHRTDIEALQEKTLYTLRQFDLSKYGAPDRMIGMSGLLSSLCRFEEYQNQKELIQNAADSLLAMKTLEYKGKRIWKPFQNTERPISGAGHGIAGIAEALFAASKILDDNKYLPAIDEAIQFEHESYSPKFGTWSDLRSYPPTGYMHGYCSGSAGIGIMLERMRKNGYTGNLLDECIHLAEQSTDSLPLNQRDHLCCGNSAIVEYYLTVDRYEEAGKVLYAMQKRCEQDGNYRYMAYQFNNSLTASLFYGASGIGYEMLRYAEPDKILSVL